MALLVTVAFDVYEQIRSPNSPSGGSTYWNYNFVALESFSWTFFKEMSEVSAADEFMYGIYKDALMVVAEFLSAAISGEGTVRVLLEETVNALIGIVVGIAINKIMKTISKDLKRELRYKVVRVKPFIISLPSNRRAQFLVLEKVQKVFEDVASKWLGRQVESLFGDRN